MFPVALGMVDKFVYVPFWISFVMTNNLRTVAKYFTHMSIKKVFNGEGKFLVYRSIVGVGL